MSCPLSIPMATGSEPTGTSTARNFPDAITVSPVSSSGISSPRYFSISARHVSALPAWVKSTGAKRANSRTTVLGNLSPSICSNCLNPSRSLSSNSSPADFKSVSTETPFNSVSRLSFFGTYMVRLRQPPAEAEGHAIATRTDSPQSTWYPIPGYWSPQIEGILVI